MLYPLYVWKDANSAYGAAFPDLPGVNTAAADPHDLNKAAQEAVEAMYEGEADIPAASAIDRWTSDPDYADGFWMLVEIDLSKVNIKPVRLNIYPAGKPAAGDRPVRQIPPPHTLGVPGAGGHEGDGGIAR
ncbi:type II toxin-antitoxin system HicB family antitoxin [Janthinobacterium sp.]|uniref:type II toxin-antitoxin system HicB family antitoxin n=1 Tax=Janthinobacterium sp. TaxID=1871054 RepID=UPI00263812C0|nr:type II toxin-antitoxin system HicB family antitoxin [Janthinobacterium sp.]